MSPQQTILGIQPQYHSSMQPSVRSRLGSGGLLYDDSFIMHKNNEGLAQAIGAHQNDAQHTFATLDILESPPAYDQLRANASSAAAGHRRANSQGLHRQFFAGAGLDSIQIQHGNNQSSYQSRRATRLPVYQREHSGNQAGSDPRTSDKMMRDSEKLMPKIEL